MLYAAFLCIPPLSAPIRFWLSHLLRGQVSMAIEGIFRGRQEYFRKITGLPINPYFSAYKLKWLLENVPAVASAAEDGSLMFGTVDSYLIWRLTGAPQQQMLSDTLVDRVPPHLRDVSLTPTSAACASPSTMHQQVQPLRQYDCLPS